MSKKLNLPKVLLVGRTNVGKSTLFNRMVGEKVSIVSDREHVTRDFIQEVVTWADKTFELLDTGGLSFSRGLDDITQKIQQKVLDLLSQASIILFICDAKQGLTDEDRKIAKLLHKLEHKIPMFLFLNKSDNSNALIDNMYEFYALGFKNIYPVSAVHGSGIGTLLDLIVENLPDCKLEEIEATAHKIVIIGKPNVGKSSLMNELVNRERSIVSDVAGTTRESISQKIFYYSELLQVTDTAGVRKRANVTDDLEELMVKSSLNAIKNADTVILMIDASQGRISDQELKLLFYAYEQRKMILVIFNKVDLVTEYSELLLKQSLQENSFIFDKIPQMKISCVTKKNISKILSELEKIWNRCEQEFDSVKLNEIVHESLTNKYLYRAATELKIFKINRLQDLIPTFLLVVNRPEFFGATELGCMENILRENYDMRGCPIKFVLKKKMRG